MTNQNKPIRRLSMTELKNIIRDPWHIIVIEPLGGDTFISTYGEGIYDLVEEVNIIDSEEHEEWANNGLIYCSRFSQGDFFIDGCQFYDEWREDAYGRQDDKAHALALELGIQTSHERADVCVDIDE